MILIITNTEDLTADFVVRELTRRAVPFARLNTDEYPVRAEAVVKFTSDNTPTASLRWTNRDRSLDWNEVTAVWYRRPVPPVVACEVSDPGVRKFAVDESYDFLRGLWYSLDCFWISHPDAIRQAEHKIVQLKQAHHYGFVIPRTVVTNCPDEVVALNEQCPHGIVAKPLYLGFLKQDQESKFIYTTKLADRDLTDSDAIRLAPAIYQEFIPKAADIRVTVVGDRVFATRIVANGLPPQTPDWRYADHSNLEHYPHALPQDEQEKCVRLVKVLNLEFGAIDYVLDGDGRYVFLEINPNGQWAWIESATGAKISAAIVDRLVAGRP